MKTRTGFFSTKFAYRMDNNYFFKYLIIDIRIGYITSWVNILSVKQSSDEEEHIGPNFVASKTPQGSTGSGSFFKWNKPVK